MSRVLVAPKGSASSYKSSTSPRYKMFIWDLGTDYKEPHEATIRTVAVLEYSSPLHELAHFSTSVRPSHVQSKKTTPTFVEAWDDLTDFISDHSEGKPPLLVSHNAAFDVTVLLTEVRRNRINIPSSWRFACSLLFARSVYSVTDNSQLALAARLGIPVSRPHNTSEDVIVLRRILRVLDENAVKDDDHLYRVVPAMCLQAHTSSFFDRTPQYDSESDATAAGKIFITNTGTKYHRGECKWLKRSKIPRDTPPPGFGPCGTCRPDDGSHAVEKSRTSSGPTHGMRDNTDRQESYSATSPPDKTQLFVTNHGQRYHVGGCTFLRKSKIPVDSPPSGFKPCGTCVQDMRPNTKSPPVEDYVAESSLSSSSEQTTYFLTRTGTKYHKKGCKSLARSCIPKNKKPVGYDPCGICLPDLAFQGTPRLRMYQKV